MSPLAADRYGLTVAARRRLGPAGLHLDFRYVGCARVIPPARGWEWARLVDQLLTAAVLLLASGRHRRHSGDIRRRTIRSHRAPAGGR